MNTPTEGPDEGAPPPPPERRSEGGGAPRESLGWRAAAAVSVAVTVSGAVISSAIIHAPRAGQAALLGLVVVALVAWLVWRRLARLRRERLLRELVAPRAAPETPAPGGERRLRWFRLRYFLGGLALGGIAPVIVPQAEGTAPPPRAPAGEIVAPQPGRVDPSEPVEGTMRGLARGQCAWLLVQEPNLGYYPQDGPIACGNGGWSGAAHFGDGARRRFTLHLVVTGPSGTQAFRRYLSPDGEPFVPFTTSELPADRRFLDSVAVYLRR